MVTRITATELSRSLSDVLSRVQYRGESFVIERNGREVARLEPSAELQAAATWEDFARLLEEHLPIGDGFADDLEWVQRNQGDVEIRDWPS